MDTKAGFEITLSSGAAWQQGVDVVAFATFGDPAKDPVFKSADQALGGALTEVAVSEAFEGKSGQTLVLFAAMLPLLVLEGVNGDGKMTRVVKLLE